MNKIITEAIEQLEYLKDKRNKLLKDIKAEPPLEGTLKIKYDKTGNARFYIKSKDSTDLKWHEHYLSKKKNNKYISNQIHHAYNHQLLNILNQEISSLEHLTKNYNPYSKYDLFANLPPAKQEYLFNIFPTPADKVAAWEMEEYETNPKYPEKLTFDTDRGEKVRSKSEGFIANYLLKNADKWAYRYEAALYVKSTGYTIYPDFTVMSRATGNIYYIEHCGRMGDIDYVNDFIKKYNSYIAEDIIPGKNLILTFESDSQALNIKSMKKLLDEMLV